MGNSHALRPCSVSGKPSAIGKPKMVGVEVRCHERWLVVTTSSIDSGETMISIAMSGVSLSSQEVRKFYIGDLSFIAKATPTLFLTFSDCWARTTSTLPEVDRLVRRRSTMKHTRD